jgi:hypothetical protein
MPIELRLLWGSGYPTDRFLRRGSGVGGRTKADKNSTGQRVAGEGQCCELSWVESVEKYCQRWLVSVIRGEDEDQRKERIPSEEIKVSRRKREPCREVDVNRGASPSEMPATAGERMTGE